MTKPERPPEFEYTTAKERSTARMWTDRRNAWVRGEGRHPHTLYLWSLGYHWIDDPPPQPPYGDCSGPYDREAHTCT